MLAAAAGLAASAAAQDVQSGIQAWQSGRYDEAVREWRPLADRGDADAQFNLGHAYRLGRGVPQNLNLAEQWYERAARAGHVEAQAMYGLILFQNGRRDEAMPYVQQAAERGDARAQYVYGTALFNGDVVERDWPRAWAFMSLAARQNFPPAQSHLRDMEAHVAEAGLWRGETFRAVTRDRRVTRLVEGERHVHRRAHAIPEDHRSAGVNEELVLHDRVRSRSELAASMEGESLRRVLHNVTTPISTLM